MPDIAVWHKDPQTGIVVHFDCNDGQVFEGEANGKIYRWEFSERWGPLFVRKDGYPMKRQPGPNHPAWEAFEAWHKQWKQAP